MLKFNVINVEIAATNFSILFPFHLFSLKFSKFLEENNEGVLNITLYNI